MNFDQLPGLRQAHLDYLLGQGVTLKSLTRNRQGQLNPPRLATGYVSGRYFVEADKGEAFIAFEEPQTQDLIFWNPKSGELATEWGRAFALGQSNIGDASTYAFDGYLNIYRTPLSWLINRRDGIVIIDWEHIYDYLGDRRRVPRICVEESLLTRFRKHIRPPVLPELFIHQSRAA